MTKRKRIRILVGDKRPIFRMGLGQLFSEEPDLSVVGEAENGRQVLRKVTELKPEILLLGSLPAGMSDLEVLEELQQKHRETRVILLASSDREDDLLKALRLGTAGVVRKQSPFSHLLQSIRKVDAGELCVDTRLSAAMRKQDSHPQPSVSMGKNSLSLSERERQVVGLVSQGFKNKEIAQRMFISEQTVKNHMHNIFDKLGVSDRLELALYAIHKNLQPVG